MNTFQRLLLSAAVALACGATLTSAPALAAPPTAAEFFEPYSLSAVELSPSGRYIAMISREPGKRAKMTVVDLEGKEPARVIAMFTKFDVADFEWINDDWLTFNLSDQLGVKGRPVGRGLNAVSRDGQKMRPLITQKYAENIEFTSKLTLTPDHQMLAKGAPGTNEIIVGQDHWNANDEYSHTTLRVLNVANGDIRSMFRNEPPNKMTGYMFDNKGVPRAAWASRDNVVKYYWADAAGTSWREIGSFNWFESDFVPDYIDDNDQLIVSVNDGPNGMAQLHKFDFKTGKPETAVFMTTPGFDTDAVPIREHGNNKVHGLRLLSDSRATAWFTPVMSALQAKIDASLPGRVNILSCTQCEAPKTVLVHSYSDTHAGEFLLYNTTTQKLQLLGDTRQGHKEDGMAEVTLHRATTRDGADLPVWITATPSQDKSPRPAVVLVHGGPAARATEWGWESEAQFLASRGYVVIEPDFRGSSGYGVRHLRAGWKQWGQRMQDDVSDALAFAVKSGQVDPKRVCIAGASYGGYAALMGAVKNNNQYKCAVAWVAVTDPSYLTTVFWDDASADQRKYSIPLTVGDPKKDAAMLDANSPLKHAAKIKIPVLLAYGGKDRRVPLVYGEEMREALINAGNRPQWIQYNDEGHGWSRTVNRIDFWTKVETFLGESLK
jgi:dipeptidyl aminopeptidase/acylaminoacyl peptidase